MHQAMGAHVIGMTNAPEAKLAREAEIASASLALVTDYDCWKIEEEAVEVSAVLENMKANSVLAKDILKAVIPLISKTAQSPAHRSLKQAIITPRELWPEETVRDLAPILNT